jgi:hypothetical protein
MKWQKKTSIKTYKAEYRKDIQPVVFEPKKIPGLNEPQINNSISIQ